MASVPPAGQLSSILQSQDTIINQQQGVAAGIDGQTYVVQRLTPTTNQSVSMNPPAIRGPYFMRPGRSTTKKLFENVFFDLLMYVGICDTTEGLELGDVLTQYGYKSDGSIFTFVQNRPTREKIFVRTESLSPITRPYPIAGRAADQPSSGNVFVEGWGGVNKSTEQVLTLTDGLYTFDDTVAPPASVYCGFQMLARVKDTSKSAAAGKMPTALYREQAAIYIPNLPGVVVQELDRVDFGGGDRFEIMEFHNTGEVGLQGFWCLGEKLGV